MKKIFLIISIIVCCFAICFSACSPSNNSETQQYDEMMESAITELTKGWENKYKEFDLENRDNAIYIKNSRIIELTDNHEISAFENIKYIIEFIIFSDYYGSGGKYFHDIGLYDTVIVYKDGSIEFSYYDIMRQYNNASYDYSFSYVSQVIELESTYNQVINLNIA